MENYAWQRPKTTRRYLHPTKAERLYTLWAEGKLILSEVDWEVYTRLDCSGLWLVHGAEDVQLDFHGAENRLPEDGVPFHGLTWRLGALQIDLDAFCDIGRFPTCFAALRLTNTGDAPLSEPLALLPRTGRERELVFSSPDVYASYAPDVNVWKNALCTWRAAETGERTVLKDDHYFLTAEGLPLSWDAESGALRFTADLAAGASRTLILSFGKGRGEPNAVGEALPFDLEEEKSRARTFWQRELSRIDRLPAAIRSDAGRLRMVQNLTVQLLQCLCYPVNQDCLIPRQGGLQRRIWPWEAAFGLEALGRIGDFSDYIEPVFSLYFDVLQAPDGEIRPAGISWANITASVLYSFARYCLDVSRRFWFRYRDAAMEAFEWVKRTRASSAADPALTPGLFPPRRANDWRQEFQAWLSTDAVNLRGLNLFAEAAEHFGDPRAAEIRAEAEDYMAVMRREMQKFIDAGQDTLRVPLCPDGNDAELVAAYYPFFNQGRFPYLGIVPDADIERVFRFLQRDGIYKDGLYGHMPRPESRHIWYTTNPELYWFLTWMRLGNRERAKEIINSQIRWSMTDEYYMLERYKDDDPWYVPWSPNFSGNGRMIIMLLEFYAD